MNLKKDFKILYDRVIKSTVWKALIYAILISFSVVFIVSLLLWIFAVKEYWIAFITLGATFIISFTLIFLFLKPSDKKFSVQLDELGLKQRVVTMYEYRNDDSLMARIQRKNAIDHVNSIDLKKLKLVIPVFVIVLTCVAFVFGAGTTTVAALSSHDKVASGMEVIEEVIPGLKNTYEINYNCFGDGFIDGDIFQVVEEGKDGSPVLAVPGVDYVFYSWDDGSTDPMRYEPAVNQNITRTATFFEIGDESQDGEPSDNEGEPGEGEDGETGEPGESSEADNQQMMARDPNDEPGGGAGGSYEENNQVIDGETYYGDAFNEAYQTATENMQQNGDMSDGDKGTVNDYFENIQK